MVVYYYQLECLDVALLFFCFYILFSNKPEQLAELLCGG